MNERPDREWIQSLVALHEGPLVSYATRLLGGDVERGRDVVQDAFLRLWQADRTQVEDHALKWLYTVCRNRALDVRRKEHRMTTLENHALESDGATPEPPAGDETGRVLGLVAGLPPRQQEAVRLKFQGGLSYREIAEVMDTTVNNVGVLLHTAVKSLKTRLADSAGQTPGDLPGIGATR